MQKGVIFLYSYFNELHKVIFQVHKFVCIFFLDICRLFDDKLFFFSNDSRSSISMIKNHPNILSNGKVLNQKQGHPTLVILAMNDFLDQRFVSPSNHHFSFLARVLLSISIDIRKERNFSVIASQ